MVATAQATLSTRRAREGAILPAEPLGIGRGADAERQQVRDQHQADGEAERARVGAARVVDLDGEAQRRCQLRAASSLRTPPEERPWWPAVALPR